MRLRHLSFLQLLTLRRDHPVRTDWLTWLLVYRLSMQHPAQSRTQMLAEQQTETQPAIYGA